MAFINYDSDDESRRAFEEAEETAKENELYQYLDELKYNERLAVSYPQDAKAGEAAEWLEKYA